MNISVLNTVNFELQPDDDKEVNFNVETVTFVLGLIKHWELPYNADRFSRFI